MPASILPDGFPSFEIVENTPTTTEFKRAHFSTAQVTGVVGGGAVGPGQPDQAG